MWKLLLAITLCFGCDSPRLTADERGVAGRPASSRGVESLVTSTGDGPARARLFTYKRPKSLERQDISGIEVVLQSDAPPSSEGYYIDVFAVAPAKAKNEKPRRIALGGQDVFKPLKEGETTTVYLDPPADDAWRRGKEGEELKLGFQIKPSNPDRAAPDVSLHIERVKASKRSGRDSDRR